MVLFRHINFFIVPIQNRKKSNQVLKILLSHLYNSYFNKSSDAAETVKFEIRVGLIIDALINARSKLFLESFVPKSKEFYLDADLLVNLPILKKCCLEAGILTAVACNCSMHKFSEGLKDFYHDANQADPQFKSFASDGYINFIVPGKGNENDSYQCNSFLKYLKIKYNNIQSFQVNRTKNFVDLSQVSIGCMKFVFEPNLKNGTEAASLVKELICILKRLDTSSCEIKGNLCIDASISLNRIGHTFGIKTEVKKIKNPNFIQKDIDYEIKRQIQNLYGSNLIMTETENFDSATMSAFLQDNTMLQDYYCMDESNITPEQICGKMTFSNCSNILNIDSLQKKLPVLPEAERSNLIEVYKLPLSIVDKLVETDGLSEAFEFIASHINDKSLIYNFLLYNVLHKLNSRKVPFKKCGLSSVQITEIIKLLHSIKISIETADDILEMLLNGDQRSAKEIVESYNWHLIYEGTKLEELCFKILSTHKKETIRDINQLEHTQKKLAKHKRKLNDYTLFCDVDIIFATLKAKKFKQTGKRHYMFLLLTALNEIENRASLLHAEEEFKKLIHNQVKKSIKN